MLKYLKLTITGAHVAFYILAWLSTISNPIVYVFSNKFYRKAFQKTFRIRNGIEASNSDKYDQSIFKSISKKLSIRSNKNRRSEMGRSAFFMSTAELNRTLSRNHLNSTRVPNYDQYQAEFNQTMSENNFLRADAGYRTRVGCLNSENAAFRLLLLIYKVWLFVNF